MAITAARVTVTTTPTLLTVGAEEDFTPGRTGAFHNPGPAAVVLGGADVEATTGLSLAAGATLGVDLGRGDQLYGIVASGTQVVHVLQVGV